MSDRLDIELRVNGQVRTATAEARTTLADFLRDHLGLTGTHLGCEHGVCGACTVVVDREPVRSCLMLAIQAEGAEITTIEGLGAPGELDDLQQAFWDAHSFQCGFCTPGFVMSVAAFLGEGAMPASDGEIREMLAGNLCRCTGYASIVEGVNQAITATADRRELST